MRDKAHTQPDGRPG